MNVHIVVIPGKRKGVGWIALDKNRGDMLHTIFALSGNRFQRSARVIGVAVEC